MMYVVALTGGIGSGKSEAAKIFAEFGVSVTDVDSISHQLTSANQPLVDVLAANFGHQYIMPDGALNRKAMRDLVFTDQNALEKLNAILHPAIYDQAIKQLQQNANAPNQTLPYQILVVPLLFESPRYSPHINRILVIDCDEKIQIERVKNRSNLPESQIMQIIKAQTSRKQRLKLANDVIENNENIEKLREKIMLTHKKYINTCILSKTIS
ncbi:MULTISPECIES: dephospho-CoA kinase [Methylotenera]|uniref:dephospho-CoA kinase n=1 Tax=Methylotenera TaxID=359407 RepID=UPI000367498B|nr:MULTISPECIES: dephospho-CoA kinase [Methylotenera]